MYNLYTKFVKILEICKQFSENLVNESGNVPRRGPVPKFSDLEVVALSLSALRAELMPDGCPKGSWFRKRQKTTMGDKGDATMTCRFLPLSPTVDYSVSQMWL